MRGLHHYLTRIIPALSIFFALVLLLSAFAVAPLEGNSHRTGQNGPRAATLPQILLAGYVVFLHVLSVVYPVRLCRAIGHVTREIRKSAATTAEMKQQQLRSSGYAKACGSMGVRAVPYFAIIIPNYKEDMETLEETLRVLASHWQARRCYDIYLAMEEREDEAHVKAEKLIKTFHRSFRRIHYTLHPHNISGEVLGKSSNEAWAARRVMSDYPEHVKSEVLITVMDADTHLSPRYFSQIANHHVREAATRQTTIYMPPVVFDRNAHRVPLAVRVADVAWAGAGISSMYAGSKVCIPTSVYTLPLPLVERVGGWDTDSGAIGEDMHMYLKCFFALSGNLQVKVVYAAASSCNVGSDGEGFGAYCGNVIARFRQAQRHMWGSLDTGYAVRRMLEMFNGRLMLLMNVPSALIALDVAIADNLIMGALPLPKFCRLNWSPASYEYRSTKPLVTRTVGAPPTTQSMSVQKRNLFVLSHRMFEAHFLPLHLALIVVASAVYEKFHQGTIPHELHLAFTFAAYARFIGMLLIMLFFYRYDAYHRLCLRLRQKEMPGGRSLTDDENNEDDDDGDNNNKATSPSNLRRSASSFISMLEALMLPPAGLLFGAIPQCYAIFGHLFTEKFTYRVSLKPRFAAVLAEQAVESIRHPVTLAKSAA